MKITVRKTLVRGAEAWVVDRSESGKRKRSFFQSKGEAEAEADTLRFQSESVGRSWMDISAQERSEIAAVTSEIKAAGLSLRSVWEQYKTGNTTMRTVRTLGEAVEETIRSKESGRRRPRYIASLKGYLRLFAKGRETLSVDKVCSADIERWFVDRKESPSTRASNLGRLSALFDLCYRRDYIPANPCDKVERVSVESGRPLIFRANEAERLIHTCAETDKSFLPYVVLGIFCGLRPDECKQLKWSDIDLDKARITIHESVSKVRHWRYVPMEPAAVEWLKLCDKRKSLIPNVKTIRRRRRRLAARAKLTWHQDVLRKTAASFLMAKHGDAGKVSEILGNSPSILKRHYRDLVLPDEADKFWNLRPQPKHERKITTAPMMVAETQKACHKQPSPTAAL